MSLPARQGFHTPGPPGPSPLTRLGWAALVCYFPLLLVMMPVRPPRLDYAGFDYTGLGPAGLAIRVALFHGVGCVGSFALLRREGALAPLAALLARPWTGLGQALLGFALLGGVATALLRLPAGSLPSWLPALLHPLDLSPLPADPRWPAGPAAVMRLALLMVGGAAEEWIFRCALWLRWAGAPPPAGQGGGKKEAGAAAVHGCKLVAVSAYFAALHWRQGAAAVLVAFSGSLVLGALLRWRRNFWLVAGLHALFNWNAG